MKRTLLLAALLAVGAPTLTEAQTVEVELGGGYVFGSGAEDPGPSLPVFDAGVAFWPSARWGIAVRVVDGPGEDLHEPVVFMDRTFFGTGHLRYWTVTARHRRALRPTWGVEIGAGLMTNGRFASVWTFTDQPESRHAGGGSDFAGLSLEGLATKTLSRHFAIKGGVTYDFNVETNNLQPVVLGTVRF
ncbi:MAG TPA: hypothetical protein VGJ39_10440 [Vicinamibacterales bacterium]